jgi:hypothetical protein
MSKLINIKEVQPNSFVFEKNHALDPQFCASVIERFEQNTQDQYQGRIGQQISEDTDITRSTDLVVSGKSHWQDVDRALFKSLGVAIREFRQQFTYFNGPFKDMGYGLQRTAPGEYYHWHIDGGSHEFSQRQLVAIWYLNDVEGPGGETEFLYQQLKIKPEAGKLVLFPPFWTHEHRGSTLQQGLKYIATTWVVFA